MGIVARFATSAKATLRNQRQATDFAYGTSPATGTAMQIVVAGDTETFRIIGAAMEVHHRLGCGFFEAVYREALAIEFLERHIPFRTEHSWPIDYRSVRLSLRYRVDFFCFESVIVEVKALPELGRLERQQTANYVRMARVDRGLLLNFGAQTLQYRRIFSACRRPPDFSGSRGTLLES